MPIGSGVAAQFGYAKESTPKTYETVDHFVVFDSEGLKQNIARIPVRGNKAGRRVSHGWKPGNTTTSGPINMPFVCEDMGELLELCMGGLVTAGSGPYTHTLTPGDLATGTFQIGKPDTGGTVRPFNYLGAMVESWELSFDASGDGNLAQFTVNLQAYEEETSTALETASYPSSITYLTSVEASLTVAGSAYCVRSGRIRGDNGLLVRHEACAADAGKPVISESGMREYSGDFLADFDSLTQYGRYTAGAESALVITLEDSSSAKLVITCNVRYDGETPNVESDAVLTQPSPFMCTSGTNDATAITMVLTNGDSAA